MDKIGTEAGFAANQQLSKNRLPSEVNSDYSSLTANLVCVRVPNQPLVLARLGDIHASQTERVKSL
jgi:hypothetical protein